MPCRRTFLRSGTLTIAITALGIGGDALLPVFVVDAEATGTEHRFPLPSADSVTIDRGSQSILVRYQNKIYAFALSCPHENAAVKWLQKDHRFQCTKHDSQYQPTGLHTAGRATRNMDRFALRRDADFIVVDLNRWYQSDKDPAGWASAELSV